MQTLKTCQFYFHCWARTILTIALLLALATSAAKADINAMKQGLALLSAGKYPEAAEIFSAEFKSNPANEQACYCLAVCHHYSGKYAEASREYLWVTKHTNDPQLVRRAQKGADGVKSYLVAAPVATFLSSSSPGGSFASEPAVFAAPKVSGATATRPRWTPSSAAGSYSAPNVPSAPGSTTGARVVDVYTVWCGPCKAFSPIFRETGDKFSSSGVIFESLDAEAPENKAFVDQYNVHAYPTVLFIDGNGNVIHKFAGYREAPEFTKEILQVWPQLRN